MAAAAAAFMLVDVRMLGVEQARAGPEHGRRPRSSRWRLAIERHMRGTLGAGELSPGPEPTVATADRCNQNFCVTPTRAAKVAAGLPER